MKWAQPSRWLHELSGTLEAGPRGIKWPILLLALIHRDYSRISGGELPDCALRESTPLPIHLDEADYFAVEALAQDWVAQLMNSVARLTPTMKDRESPWALHRELVSGQRHDAIALIGAAPEDNEWEVSQPCISRTRCLSHSGTDVGRSRI